MVMSNNLDVVDLEILSYTISFQDDNIFHQICIRQMEYLIFNVLYLID